MQNNSRYRGNFQGGNHQYQQRQPGVGNQMMQGARHHSVNPSQMVPGNQIMPHQQQMVYQQVQQPVTAGHANMMQHRPPPAPIQHGVSGGGSGSIDGGASSSMNSSSANQGQPQYADQAYAHEYYLEIRNMFASDDYKKLQNRQQKKEMIGNTIYKHVEKLVGD